MAAVVQTVVTALIVLSGFVLFTGAFISGTREALDPVIAVPATGILLIVIMVPASECSLRTRDQPPPVTRFGALLGHVQEFLPDPFPRNRTYEIATHLLSGSAIFSHRKPRLYSGYQMVLNRRARGCLEPPCRYTSAHSHLP